MQYWDLLRGETLRETIGNLFNFVEGGLVVYGSLIGALLGMILFVRKFRLPLLPTLDLIAPSLKVRVARRAREHFVIAHHGAAIAGAHAEDDHWPHQIANRI